MASPFNTQQTSQIRTYRRAASVVFLKTNEGFGGLSNMAGGFPLKVNGLRIFTAEALYQACRFPHRPDVQRLIIAQASPMTAKMKSKPYRYDSRPDWDQVRVKIMRWCLRVKLAQNWGAFAELLLKTGDRPIVEQSRKDDFWGAKEAEEGTLTGRNVLGRLLMELREAVQAGDKDSLLSVEPLVVPDFLLDGRHIQTVSATSNEDLESTLHSTERVERLPNAPLGAEQALLFDQPPPKESSAPFLTLGQARAKALADLQVYPVMKDSGVAWLGKVPQHWEVLPNRALFVEVKDRGHPEEQMLSVTITKGITRQRTLLADTSKKDSSNQDKSAYKLVRPGDIAYNKMRAWQGAIGASAYRGIVSPAYVVQRPRAGADPRYFHYLLRTPAFAKEAERWSYGITSDMWSLRPEHFKMIYGCLPPLPEQAAIVRFLDHEDRRIRTYIGAKQKLIKLLEEQRRGIIHHAVTRGLDPNVRLEPSGVDWLGDVPAHWEIWQIGHFAAVGNGSTPSRGNMAYWAGGAYPWLNSSSVNTGTIAQADQFVTEAALNECHLPKVPAGSVLVAITGQGKTRGTAAVLTIEATINQHIAFITPRMRRPTATPNYLRAFLVAAYSELRRISEDSGSTKGALTCEDLRHFRVALPPLDEQMLLVGLSMDATAQIDAAIRTAVREIALLREYRTRLITDVVTGKLDVRELAAQLPDEPEQLDESDTLTEGDSEAEVDDSDVAAEEAEVTDA